MRKPYQPSVEAERQRRRENLIISATFSNRQGQLCLKLLKTLFDGQTILVPGDPYTTHFKLGQAEVVKFIEQALNEAKGAANVEETETTPTVRTGRRPARNATHATGRSPAGRSATRGPAPGSSAG